MVEGVELLSTALAAGVRVESVYVAAERPVPCGPLDEALGQGARVFELAPGVLERVADTVHPQPVVSVVGFRPAGLDEHFGDRPAADDDLVVVCSAIRDPGNAGTVVRTADAAGATAVVFAGETVDPTNPKTVRASAGSLFHLPVVEGGPVLAAVEALRRRGYLIVATVARDGTDYAAFDWRRPVALVLGNEASGLAPEVVAAADAAVTVPLSGRAESLNVSAAAAVLCFEARRQRTAARTRPGSVDRGGAGSTMPGMRATRTATGDG